MNISTVVQRMLECSTITGIVYTFGHRIKIKSYRKIETRLRGNTIIDTDP